MERRVLIEACVIFISLFNRLALVGNGRPPVLFPLVWKASALSGAQKAKGGKTRRLNSSALSAQLSGSPKLPFRQGAQSRYCGLLFKPSAFKPTCGLLLASWILLYTLTQWLLRVGPSDGESVLQLPGTMGHWALPRNASREVKMRAWIVDFVYPNWVDNVHDSAWLSGR